MSGAHSDALFLKSDKLKQTPKLSSVGRLVEQWVKKQFQTKVVLKGQDGAFYHVAAVTGRPLLLSTYGLPALMQDGGGTHHTCIHIYNTGFLGFIDDMAIELSCVDMSDPINAQNGTVVVRIQSEQRFGTLDANVNKKRAASLISFINSKAHGLPKGTCSVPI